MIHRTNSWNNFRQEIQNKKKIIGCYQIEHIDDHLCLLTLVVNPKEYIEKCENINVNKKHKRLRNSAKGMFFENYSKRINLVRDIEDFGQLLPDKQKQNRFAVKNKTAYILKRP